MVQNFLHLVNVLHSARNNWLNHVQENLLCLGLIANVEVLLVHSDQSALALGFSHNHGYDVARSVFGGFSRLQGPRSDINNDWLCVVFHSNYTK